MRRDHDKWFHPSYGKKSRITRLLEPYDKFVTLITPHNAQPYLKSTFEEVWDYAGEELTKASLNRFRSPNDYTQELFRTWQICRSNFVPYNTYSDTKMFPLIFKSKQAIRAIKEQRYKADLPERQRPHPKLYAGDAGVGKSIPDDLTR